MPRRSRNKLEKWEVSAVKAMLGRDFIPQDILAYFTRPTRSINHARISEIRDGKKHKLVKPLTELELDEFLDAWPNIDPVTGLHFQGDELLIKSRDAMTAAVHTFNSAGIYFRAEIFIVTSIIAWTYLLHAFYKKSGIDYHHKRQGEVQLTPNGAEKYWELGQCIATDRCPLDRGVINNLKFLIEIRHEIEHRSTSQIDDSLSAKLQACCINFNDAIKSLFGKEFSIEKRLPIALQFVAFDGEQRRSIIGANLPQNIATAMDNFHESLTEAEQMDSKFRYRVAFVPKVSGKVTKADHAIEFVRPGSLEAAQVERVLLKETERPKFRPTEIVHSVQSSGFAQFTLYDHGIIAQQLDARNPDKGYGVIVAKNWVWYSHWKDKIIEKLNEGWARPAR